MGRNDVQRAVQVARAVSAPGANSSAYCKYDNQGLQAFTSVLFLVCPDYTYNTAMRRMNVTASVPLCQRYLRRGAALQAPALLG